MSGDLATGPGVPVVTSGSRAPMSLPPFRAPCVFPELGLFGAQAGSGCRDTGVADILFRSQDLRACDKMTRGKSVKSLRWILALTLSGCGGGDGSSSGGGSTPPGPSAPIATTPMLIASASKWFFGSYLVQVRDGSLSAQDIEALTMNSGYTNLSYDSCIDLNSAAQDAETVDRCFHANNLHGTNADFNPSAAGFFLLQRQPPPEVRGCGFGIGILQFSRTGESRYFLHDVRMQVFASGMILSARCADS